MEEITRSCERALEEEGDEKEDEATGQAEGSERGTFQEGDTQENQEDERLAEWSTGQLVQSPSDCEVISLETRKGRPKPGATGGRSKAPVV